VTQYVVFAGEVPYADLPAYFRAGDVFAMPCRSRFGGLETEALGAVYLQASAVGRPCVGGRAGGAPEAVRHGKTGLVVDGTSVSEVAAAVRDLLRDRGRAQSMGAEGAAWVHRELTWDRLAARLHAMLADCVARPTALG
jgi:phosphatidylinositol alpha-1,6-mannosyltransferase